MKRTTKFAAALAIALGAALAASTIQAHPFGNGPGWGMSGGAGWGPGYMMGHRFGPGPGYGMGPGYGRGPGYGPGGAENPGAFFENRLAALKSELAITPAQEAAWNAYAEQAKLQADAMQKLHSAMLGSASATLPERLELRDQIHKQRQAQAETMTQKIKDLYAALTPEQKSIADQRFGGYGMAMRGGPGYRFR